ncbi:MAG: phosphoribosylglycinamide formyltransferase, formyltetrahydrofolate-dependent [Acidimicrobiaceae bacterium]|nr:phosphoribosylglycinamide formyltransferase, formyltetrahydrofolate-dependent [Acidimicrobiaceae bacterium]
MEALLDDAELPIAVVLLDRPCPAAKVAERAGVPVELVERTDFGSDFDREAYTERVVAALAPYRVGMLAMAGFGTVVGSALHRAYPGTVLNTHPALLPAFKGWHAVSAALAAGVKVTGCTVHVATLEVDDGPILAQEAVPVLEDDTEASLHERIKAVERRLYPEAVRRFADELALGRDESPSKDGEGERL